MKKVISVMLSALATVSFASVVFAADAGNKTLPSESESQETPGAQPAVIHSRESLPQTTPSALPGDDSESLETPEAQAPVTHPRETLPHPAPSALPGDNSETLETPSAQPAVFPDNNMKKTR